MDALEIFLSGRFYSLFWLLFLSIFSILYWLGTKKFSQKTGEVWSRKCTLAFSVAVSLTLLVTQGPIGQYATVFFWCHMVQHLTLMMVVAPLVVMSNPVKLLVASGSENSFAVRLASSFFNSRIWQGLTNAITSWILYVFVLFSVHFTGVHATAMDSWTFHTFFEIPLYLIVGIIYYYPIFGDNPCANRLSPGMRIVSLMAMMAPETMSGFFIYAHHELIISHQHMPGMDMGPGFGPSPLVDQQIAGSLLWAFSMVIDSVWIALAASMWFRSEKFASEVSASSNALEVVADE
jgi:cytochrome c oxidase assembly factor CtaG